MIYSIFLSRAFYCFSLVSLLERANAAQKVCVRVHVFTTDSFSRHFHLSGAQGCLTIDCGALGIKPSTFEYALFNSKVDTVLVPHA